MKIPKFQSTARPGRGLVIALVVCGVCFTAAMALLFWQGSQRQDAIDKLAGANSSNEAAVDALCEEQPKDPVCKQAEKIPSTDEIVDETEIQDPEIQDIEIQEPEIQDPENQQSERQDPEGQDPETQESEVQDVDPDDPDADDPEVQDPEVQDPEIDDPDPNSALNFEVSDNCTPPQGEVVVDVGLQVSRSPGVVTYTVTCQTAPSPNPAAGP